MEHHGLPLLIRDLAIILMTAGITSVLFRRLKQPVILGYILAGVLVGPFMPWWANVSDSQNIKVWGDIGVIFVLFTLGLEFSFRRLLKLSGPAVITGVFETLTVLGLGMLAGRVLGWSPLHALFLGGIVAISSTTVVLKVFEDQKIKGRKFADLVMGVLIVEDLVAILLLVLLSTAAITEQFNGMELLKATLRLAFFLVLWFVVGLLVLPRMVTAVKKYLNEETALISSVGLCLLMVLIATQAGFSPALGAFVMGSLLAESSEGHRLEKTLHPLRNFFGAIFFVSVGMLFDPSSLKDIWPHLLLLTALVIVGKSFAVLVGGIIAGQSMGNSLRAGLSMTQIGEFSFILAGIGLSLGVTEASLYPLAVSVSILTTFFTPYLLKHSDQILFFVEKSISSEWKERLANYQNMARAQTGASHAPKIFRSYLPIVLINLVLLIATTWAVRRVVYPEMREWLGDSGWVKASAALVNISLCAPFLWGLSLKKPNIKILLQQVWIENLIAVARLVFGAMFFFAIVSQYLSWGALSGLTFIFIVGLALAFWRLGGRTYHHLERLFLGHFKETNNNREKSLVPWDAQLTEVMVSPESVICGQTIDALGWTRQFGVTIVAIERGHQRRLAPRANDVLFPQDVLSVLGKEADVEKIRKIAEPDEVLSSLEVEPLQLESVVIDSSSSFCGKTIRDSGIRDLVNGLVVGVEKSGEQKLNPPAELLLEAGDRLWIVGDVLKIRELKTE